MTDSTKLAADCHALAARAIKAARRAGWDATASDLESDLHNAGTDLRELLMVRDSAEYVLDSLQA